MQLLRRFKNATPGFHDALLILISFEKLTRGSSFIAKETKLEIIMSSMDEKVSCQEVTACMQGTSQ